MLPLPAITLVSAEGPGPPISLPVMSRLRSSFVGVTPISPIWSGPGVFEAAERRFRDDGSQTPGYEIVQGCRDIVGRLAAPEHLCSDLAQQGHDIIRNRVALVCEESVSMVTGGTRRLNQENPTHAHLHHW